MELGNSTPAGSINAGAGAIFHDSHGVNITIVREDGDAG
jgi:hypothetical protein